MHALQKKGVYPACQKTFVQKRERGKKESTRINKVKKDALKKVCEEQAEKAGPSPAKKDSEKKQKSQRVKIRNLTDAVLVQLSSYYQKEARPF